VRLLHGLRLHGDLRLRVAERRAKDLPWYLRPLFWAQKRRWGQVLVPALTWARVPAYYLALIHFYAAIERRGSPLEPALRSLVQARISQLNHCEFCIDINVMLAAERAGSMDKALAVAEWRRSPLYSERERAALEYAEAVTRSAVSDEMMARLREHFTEDAVVELTGLAAFQNMSAKFNAALDIPSQGFCAVPGRKQP
jgi:AhpD family alkylhydroperoxidase